jgi:hypothetical protein
MSKPSRSVAEAKANRHGSTRYFASYAEAVTGLKHLKADWGAAAMYRDGEGYIVYGWYDHAGRVRSGREDNPLPVGRYIKVKAIRRKNGRVDLYRA